MKSNITAKHCKCKHHVGPTLLPIEQFATRKPCSSYTDGILNMCKVCLSTSRRLERQKNKDRVSCEQKRWRKRNVDKIKQTDKNYRESAHGKNIRGRSYAKNRKQKRLYDANRRQNEPYVRERYNAAAAKYRASKLQATPGWFEKEDIDQTYIKAKQMTVDTGIKHHVDHIIPLQGDVVSGLHCLSNLQIIPAIDNITKSNIFVV